MHFFMSLNIHVSLLPSFHYIAPDRDGGKKSILILHVHSISFRLGTTFLGRHSTNWFSVWVDVYRVWVHVCVYVYSFSNQRWLFYDYSTTWKITSKQSAVTTTKNLSKVQFIRRTRALMRHSLFPWSPPSMKCRVFFLYPPRALLSLNGHKKLLASLKLGPTVKISCNKSSMQMIPFLPSTW